MEDDINTIVCIIKNIRKKIKRIRGKKKKNWDHSRHLDLKKIIAGTARV